MKMWNINKARSFGRRKTSFLEVSSRGESSLQATLKFPETVLSSNSQLLTSNKQRPDFFSPALTGAPLFLSSADRDQSQQPEHSLYRNRHNTLIRSGNKISGFGSLIDDKQQHRFVVKTAW